jgi:hypothetical protein
MKRLAEIDGGSKPRLACGMRPSVRGQDRIHEALGTLGFAAR